MAINKNISVTKERHGYLTSNDRVHNPTSPDDLQNMYGSTGYGQKGVGNHDNLGSIFSNPNSFVNVSSPANNEEESDFVAASSFLLGRFALSGETSSEEIENQVADLNAQIESLNARLASIPDTTDNGVVRSSITTSIANIGTRISNYTTLIDETDGNDVANAIDALGTELESQAYNPDFPSGSVSFSYNDTTDSNRSNDGIQNDKNPNSPNIAYPSANPNFDNHEANIGHTPGQGSGGFFPTNNNHQFTNTVSSTIVGRYTNTPSP